MVSKNKSGWRRNLTASLAGARAGSAFVADSFLKKVSVRDENKQSEFLRREALKFVNTLGELKGSYVKIGQMLALLGEHFLPPELTEALHDLEDSTETIDWADLKAAHVNAVAKIEQDYSIDPTAIAAASLAQVHLAKAKHFNKEKAFKGQLSPLAIKLQYPNLRASVDADFHSVKTMLKLARFIKTGRDIDQWLDSIRVQLHRELDYRQEAASTQRFYAKLQEWNQKQDLSNLSAVCSPRILSDYSDDSCLALSYIDGLHVSHEDVQALSLSRRNKLGKSMLMLFFAEVFEWGEMQSDPNFGNYLICIDDTDGDFNEKQDKLALLDFGAVQSVNQEFLQGLKKLINAGMKADQTAITDALYQLRWLQPGAKDYAIQSFSKFVSYLLEPLRPADQLPKEFLSENGEYCWAKSKLINRTVSKGTKHASSIEFTMPEGDFVLIARRLTGVFTFISALNAEFNAHQLVHDYLESKQ